MIRRISDNGRRISTKWKAKFVWLRIVKIEQPKSVKPTWGIVFFDTIETRYSADQRRTLWRLPA